MSSLLSFGTVIFSFLLTYLFHSTVIIGVIALLVNRTNRFRQPTLHVLSWKLAILLPLLTTSLIAFGPFPHWGFQLVLSESPTRHVAVHGDLPSFEVNPAPETDAAVPISEPMPSFRDQTERSEVFSDVAGETATRMNPRSNWEVFFLFVAGLWLVSVLVGLARLFIHSQRLRKLRMDATPIREASLQSSLNRLAQKIRVRHPVELLEAPEVTGGLTAGIWRPFIIVQTESDGANRRDADPEWEALLAHELAHIAHRDATWNLLTQIVLRLFPFQPLNRTVARQLQITMDFAADQTAAKLLGGQHGLIQCLIRMGDQMLHRQTLRLTRSGLVAGMVAFRSTLGQRVERLLIPNNINFEVTQGTKVKVLACLTLIAMTLAALVPQAVAEKRVNSQESQSPSPQGNMMKSQISALAVLMGLTAPVDAQEPQASKPVVQQTEELKKTPDALPAGIERFNGMLVGRLAAKDVEKGSFVVVVDVVPRVWRNSRAENPKSIVGKSIEIEGVFGRFLDVLVTTRIGETLEFECKHDGDALVFPGELLRKVAPYKAGDYPELPEAFRGFRGAVVAAIKKKDPETFELIVEVQKIADVWEKSGAKKPESIVGKPMMLAGFWNRKDEYHKLKVGDQIEVGVQHIGRQSEHLTVAEFVRQSERSEQAEMKEMRRETPVAEGKRSLVQGFRGMLVGRLVKKDVERGTFTVTVDAVPRVWKNNRSRAPKSLIGREVNAEGVPARLLDALVVTRVGETIQFGALHDGEDSLRVGEVLRKVAPVETGDYPELPDDFRGFSGILQAKVVKKDEQLWELTAEVTGVVKTFEKNRSRNAESVVGKQVMLSGFWNKKDAYHSLSVGDKIQVGVEHPQRLGDQLSVIEGVRKLED